MNTTVYSCSNAAATGGNCTHVALTKIHQPDVTWFHISETLVCRQSSLIYSASHGRTCSDQLLILNINCFCTNVSCCNKCWRTAIFFISFTPSWQHDLVVWRTNHKLCCWGNGCIIKTVNGNIISKWSNATTLIFCAQLAGTPSWLWGVCVRIDFAGSLIWYVDKR